jgi:hypothetical protein
MTGDKTTMSGPCSLVLVDEHIGACVFYALFVNVFYFA